MDHIPVSSIQLRLRTNKENVFPLLIFFVFHSALFLYGAKIQIILYTINSEGFFLHNRELCERNGGRGRLYNNTIYHQIVYRNYACLFLLILIVRYICFSG